MRCIRVAAAALVLSLAGAAEALTVNSDLGAPTAAIRYVGNDAVLSDSGRTVWNHLLGRTGTGGLLGEFENTSGVKIRVASSRSDTFTDLGIDILQDSRATDSITLYGLDPFELYAIAAFVAFNDGFGVNHASGDIDFFSPGNPGTSNRSLPDSEAILDGSVKDYYLSRQP